MALAHMHHGAERVITAKKLEVSSDMNITPMIDCDSQQSTVGC